MNDQTIREHSAAIARAVRLAFALAVLGAVGWAGFATEDHNGSADGAALCRAAIVGDCDAVERELSRGASTEDQGMTGATPLFHAAFCGHERVAALLLARGARVDAASVQHAWTPLTAAAAGGHTPVVRLLLSHGADVRHRAASGQSPLFCAATFGHGGAVEALLAAGSEVDARSRDGRTPLMAAAGAGNTEVVRMLLAAGASVGAGADDGMTAADLAVAEGNPDAARLLNAAAAAKARRASRQTTRASRP